MARLLVGGVRTANASSASNVSSPMMMTLIVWGVAQLEGVNVTVPFVKRKSLFADVAVMLRVDHGTAIVMRCGAEEWRGVALEGDHGL